MRIPAKVVKDMERRKKAFITDGRSRKFIEECVADGQREVTKDPPTFQEICDSAPPPVRKTIENPECIHGIIQYSVICLKCNPEPEHVKQATPPRTEMDYSTVIATMADGEPIYATKAAPRPVVDEEAEKGQAAADNRLDELRSRCTEWLEANAESDDPSDSLANFVRTEAARAGKDQ